MCLTTGCSSTWSSVCVPAFGAVVLTMVPMLALLT
nr:MAG TPA: hypothetical protein [Caudoviricetes sp.]